MIPLELFQRLRSAQQRSVREQELLSGRNWILVCALAHLFVSIHPLYLWVNVWMYRSRSLDQPLHPGINVAATLGTSALLFLFWWWARYAPYRAALAALVSFAAVQAGLAVLDPHQLLIGASIKALILLGLIQAVRVGFGRHRAL
jgi:hypothetical protein